MGEWATPLLLKGEKIEVMDAVENEGEGGQKHHSGSEDRDTRDWRSVSGGGSDRG